MRYDGVNAGLWEAVNMGQRLIDAEALGIGKAKREAFVVPEIADGWNAVIDIIAHAPTVDAVPVVRCKDCKKSSQTESGKRYCTEPMGAFYGCIPVEDNFFCSGGARKEQTVKRWELDNG